MQGTYIPCNCMTCALHDNNLSSVTPGMHGTYYHMVSSYFTPFTALVLTPQLQEITATKGTSVSSLTNDGGMTAGTINAGGSMVRQGPCSRSPKAVVGGVSYGGQPGSLLQMDRQPAHSFCHR